MQLADELVNGGKGGYAAARLAMRDTDLIHDVYGPAYEGEPPPYEPPSYEPVPKY